jgi:error-prone DNA polymerase
MLATNDLLYHHWDREPLQTVLTCIREHLTIATAGLQLESISIATSKPRSNGKALLGASGCETEP